MRRAKASKVGKRASKAAPKRKSAKVGGAAKPRKPKRALAPRHDMGGPLGWLLPTLESAYAPLLVRDAPAPTTEVTTAVSAFRPTTGGRVAASQPTVWRDVLLEYKQRKAARFAPTEAAAPAGPAAAFVPGGRNWQPLGPTVVLNGQTVGTQPVGGRVARLAIAPDATVIYAASANGGVFRSSNGGTSWQPLMDRFDLQPTNFASSSLACGAIALDPKDPNRVYVGTGEGDTFQLFQSRVTGALPAYRGVGVIRTDNGGNDWEPEPSTPDLAGEAFFDLAIDPNDRENVIGATTKGLYCRMSQPDGTFQWQQVRAGVHPSVTVAGAGGAVRFFAAEWGQNGNPSGAFYWNGGGSAWLPCGTGFPTNDVGRVALGVQPTNPDLVYAFVATRQKGVSHGLYRLDGVGTTWQQVANLPDVLPLDEYGNSQGAYDLCIAVDPANADIVYLGGSYADIDISPASIWRCKITKTSAGYKVDKSASIGTHAHSDVHSLIHTPGLSNELWCTCDGGVFLNRDPLGAGEFDSQNAGLACLCSNFIGQHPTDPSIIFTGLQDNGTARATGASMWTRVTDGDGGYCLVNWATPNLVLAYQNGYICRSITGGMGGWSYRRTAWSTMTQPIVGTPYNPSRLADADVVAVADGKTIYISHDFASSFDVTINITSVEQDDAVFALAFASPDRLFIGTTTGHVFRADRQGNTWKPKQLDQPAAGALGLRGIVSDVAVDWKDPNRNSVYVAFAGRGDPRHVWWYDGTQWYERSGASGANRLLDVEHNALAIDPEAPDNVYAGADIGVWHSADRGQNWQPLENGLPDAPVFDLQIHPTQRLLRAATHGRGIYEYSLK